MRRVRFENMIYIADGSSDIPAFSLLNKNGGATFAIYPKGDKKAFQWIEQMRHDGCMRRLTTQKEPQLICGFAI